MTPEAFICIALTACLVAVTLTFCFWGITLTIDIIKDMKRRNK